MASIWMSLDSVPLDDVVSSVFVPMIRALGAHGIHANLTPTTDRIFRNEGTLAFALFPGGELVFIYTTGPTDGIPSRYLMAEIRGLPSEITLTENDVAGAIRQFQSDLIENEVYVGRTQVTEGKSFGGSLNRAEITNLNDPGPPKIPTTDTPAPESAKADTNSPESPTTLRRTQAEATSPQNTRADTDSLDTAAVPYEVRKFPAGEPRRVSDVSRPRSSGAVRSATPDNPVEEAIPKKGCYIATAVFGGYDAPQVRVLRRFRDDRLAKTIAGRNAIRLYYMLSPVFAHHLGNETWFQNITRPVLEAIVSRLRAHGISDAIYSDPEQES